MRVRVLAILVARRRHAPRRRRARRNRSTATSIWKIRREATDNSRIMSTLQVLTDVYGPRLTGSPNLKGAAEWVVKEATTWGLKNAQLEPWEFGHPGWLNEKLSVHVVSPVKDALVVEALAWTPGTNGPITAQILPLELPQRPTKEQLTAFFDQQRAAVKGKIVMVGKPESLAVTIVPPAKRRDDNDVRAQFSGAGTPGGPQGPPAPTQKPDPNIVPAGPGRRAARSVPRRRRRGRPRQRRRPRPRTDSRLQQPHLRHRQGGADRRDAQRGLRPPVAAEGRRTAGRARAEHRQPDLSRRHHAVQRRRRDSGHRQGGRSGDARRPSRLVALRRPAPPTTRSAARRCSRRSASCRRSASSRAARFAWRSGAARNRGCSARRPT